MSRNITKKQKIFADEYLDTGNGTQSALKAYNTNDYNTASVISSENLEKPKIIRYLEDNAGAVASNMIRLALKAKNEQVQVNAGKDVLDRAGYKPTEKTDITSGGEKIPIYGGLSISEHNGDKEDISVKEED